jgi:imidazole glycerol-phosphate synthase subunit HisH
LELITEIGVVDVGLGNIGSVLRMIAKAGGQGRRVTDPADTAAFGKLILPGVGHFDHGMRLLGDAGFVPVLRAIAARGEQDLLGICLGMQLLFEGSQEGKSEGLGLVAGQCVRFETSHLRVPHMGWNEVDVTRNNPLIAPREPDGRRPRFYFVHSFHVVCSDPQDVIGTVDYGGSITAAVQHGRVFGTQFHPEKSHRFGLELIRSYLELQ